MAKYKAGDILICNDYSEYRGMFTKVYGVLSGDVYLTGIIYDTYDGAAREHFASASSLDLQVWDGVGIENDWELAKGE